MSKKFMSLVLSVVIILTLVSSSIMMVSASYQTATEQVSLNSTYGKTEQFSSNYRVKGDASSIYLKSGSSLAGAYIVRPYGGVTTAASGMVDCTYNGVTVVTSTNKVYRQQNLVYETFDDTGKTIYARLHFSLYTSSIGSGSLTWKADSLNSDYN